MKKAKSHYCKECSFQFNAPSDLEKRMAYACPNCKSQRFTIIPGRAPCMYSDRHDFHREKCPYTGLDGRYFPQLARFPNDPAAVVKDVNEGIEKGKRRGMIAEKMA